jgi:RNA polymerase sigma-70 factor (ECF subfamily)
MTSRAQNEPFWERVQEHRGILYKVASAYCRDPEDRRDLVQEILIQLWRAFPRFSPAQRFSTWMYRIAMNVAISAYRSRSRRVRATVPIEGLAEELAAADRIMEDAGEDLRLVRRLIGELDELSRALLLLYLDGEKHEAIAEILGISVASVATRINRLKSRLARALDAAHGPETKESRK